MSGSGGGTTLIRKFRIASLLVPMFIVTVIVADEHGSSLVHGAGFALYGIWLALVAILGVRFVIACREKVASPDAMSPWAAVDVLTASGTSMLWTGVGALVGARVSGWASLSVIGVLGVGVVQLAALWTAATALGERPWRRAKVTRQIVPSMAVEGEPLTEEVRIVDLVVPAGMRLFVVGRAMRHGVPSRYVVEGRDACGEVKLTGELGPAMRGEHRSPPLAMWLGDVLGLTRTPVAHRGEAAFTVLPQLLPVDGAQTILGAGGDAAIATPAHKAPTDGLFRIREYAPGDDARRIHWVRAAQRDDLVVRLPDEVPPAEPAVRLVLDNELSGAEMLTCRAADELLDALVRVWLGVAKTLAASGTRVTLVAVAPTNGKMTTIERRLDARATQQVRQLGSRVSWQGLVPLESLIGERRERHVVVSARPRRVSATNVHWIVVPESAWTTIDAFIPVEETFENPYPVGSPENRRTRRERERRVAMMRWQDRAFFSQIVCWSEWSGFRGEHVARYDRARSRVFVEVIP